MLKVEVIGNIGGDATVKKDGGREFVQFSVASTRRYTNSEGNAVDQTDWISCFYHSADSKVVPFLKAGTRVFVRGSGELRLFSSAKERRMKAGLSVNVQEIELLGGQRDDVPREVALSTGELVQVGKYYWIDVSKIDPKPAEVFTRRGERFAVNPDGFIQIPVQSDAESEAEQTEQVEDAPEENESQQ